MDPRKLDRLLALLRRHGVTRYVVGDFEVELTGAVSISQDKLASRPKFDPREPMSVDAYLKARLTRSGGN